MRTRAEIETAIEAARMAQAHYERDFAEAQAGMEQAQNERAELEAELAKVVEEEARRYVPGLYASIANGEEFRELETVAGECDMHALNRIVNMGGNGVASDVFVEIDRLLIVDTIRAAGGNPDLVAGTALWSHLWVAVVRIDTDGDLVLHVTSGERAQFGRDDVTPKGA
jgi:hypothetical protein